MKRFHDPISGFVQVRDCMVQAVTIRACRPLREAARALLDSAADALIVIHDTGELSGLITERELVFGAQAQSEGGSGRVGEYAHARFELAHERESLEVVLHRMAN